MWSPVPSRDPSLPVYKEEEEEGDIWDIQSLTPEQVESPFILFFLCVVTVDLDVWLKVCFINYVVCSRVSPALQCFYFDSLHTETTRTSFIVPLHHWIWSHSAVQEVSYWAWLAHSTFLMSICWPQSPEWLVYSCSVYCTRTITYLSHATQSESSASTLIFLHLLRANKLAYYSSSFISKRTLISTIQTKFLLLS